MSARVFIGRLSSRASERDVEHFFRGYGRLKDIALKNGFGFVEFESSREADDAIYDLNGKELGGERVTLELSRSSGRGGGGGDRGGGGRFDRGPPRRNDRFPPPTQTRHWIRVENLSTAVSWQDLKDLMRSHGEVTFADAHKRTKNEGIVCFGSREDLKRAMDKMQGKDVNGRKIKLVDESEGADSRSRSRSRSASPRRRTRSPRSRSRSPRSRSRSPRGKKSRSRSRSDSKSRSGSPPPKKAAVDAEEKEVEKKEKSKSRSRSRSASRSRSGSPEA